MRQPLRKKAPLVKDLRVAAQKNDVARMQKLLLAGVDVNAADNFGRGPLHQAAAKNASAVAKALIEAGADIEAADSTGWRPLHEAASKDATSVAKVLMAVGADVEATDRSGWRPLHVAALKNAAAMAKDLMDAGAHVEAVDLDGVRPLHQAAANDATSAAEVLMEAGADINATDKYKESPLHFAAKRGFVATVRALFEAGANPRLNNNEGKTPAELAMDRQHDGVVKALKEEAERCSTKQPAQQSQDRQEENMSDGTPSHELVSLTQPPTRHQRPALIGGIEDALKETPHVASQPQAQSTQSSESDVELAPSQPSIGEEQRNSASSDSDSSWTSEEVTDEARAVQDLKEDEIFAESYRLVAEPIFGKPLVRLAKELVTDRGVVLKFYDRPELYAKALSSYETLNKSRYICKPLEKIKAHQGFPNCLAFEKGIHTLDEWLRIPEVDPVSKKEALKLVAVALNDLHDRGVVHSDVKPANLAFFPAEHKWKLLDIDSALEVGVVGEIITTISYASPEVLEAVEADQTDLALHTSTDMWAYGIIAFEVFTGMRFYEFEPTVESVLEFLRSDKFKKRLEAVEDRRHRHFVKKFLKRNAVERYCARRACTSSIFESATVTVSKSLVSHVNKRT